MHHIHVVNLTTESLLWTCGEQSNTSPSGSTITLHASHRHRNLTFTASIPEKVKAASLPEPTTIAIRRHSKPWKCLELPVSSAWKIYSLKVNRRNTRLLVLPNRNAATFLSQLPDKLSLRSLMLPGTHETMAFYGWPHSQCQSEATPLAAQLQAGIRVIDIRLAVIDGALIAYHGIYPEQTPFKDIVSTVYAFLTAPTTRRETVIMSVKQEDQASLLFSQLVHEAVYNGPGGKKMWFLENRIPTLGEVRGKVILFSRFGGDGTGWEKGLEGLGIHPTNWPDSPPDPFYWQCKDTAVRTHDWYAIPSFLSIPEKASRATEILFPPADGQPTLSITFLSASKFPLALPPIIAQGFGFPQWNLGFEGVNSKVVQWLLGLLTPPAGSSAPIAEPRLRGWVMLDFYSDPDSSLVPLLIECNFRGRKKGEEGW